MQEFISRCSNSAELADFLNQLALQLLVFGSGYAPTQLESDR